MEEFMVFLMKNISSEDFFRKFEPEISGSVID